MRLTHLSMQHPLVHRYHLYYINAAGDKTEKVLPGTAKTYTIDNCRGQPLTPGQEVYCNIECVPHILGLLPSAAPHLTTHASSGTATWMWQQRRMLAGQGCRLN